MFFEENDFSESNSTPGVEFDTSGLNLCAQPTGKKRGRKAVRPLLKGKKTEDLDKYWIRKFRAYIRRNAELLSRCRDTDFWAWFLSKEGEPGLFG
jgi:hypothetical protein